MRAWLIATILIVALAGCADPSTDEDPNDADPTGTPGDGPDGTDGVIDNTTLLAVLAASAANGTAPLEVAFNISAQGASANATWVLDFGNGNATNGTSLPATANHTFQVGNFSIVLEVTDGDAAAIANVTLVVAAGQVEAPRPVPEQLQYTFGESLGCAGDVLQEAGADCISALEGPSASGIDGFWIELGPAYWGYKAATTVDNNLGDSDCYWTDADFGFLADGNAGSAACSGTVPAGAAWMFLYSYAEPAFEQTLTFSLE